MNKIIPYGKQHITEEDIQAVISALQSDYLTQGPQIKAFEEAFAQYVGAKYAVAVANGTAALHLNCLALGVKEGHKVITSPITFAASANCVRYCGGEVVFVDIDPDTYFIRYQSSTPITRKCSQRNLPRDYPSGLCGKSSRSRSLQKISR